MLLTRDAILEKKSQIVTKKVVLDESKEDFVYVKEMTGAERDEFEKLLVKQIGTGTNVKFQNSFDNFRGKICVMSVCDENGKLIFEPKDYLLFSESLPATTIDKIVKASQELNKISEEKMEESVKN